MRSSCPRCGSGSAPDPTAVRDLALIAYLACQGARTPLLAFLAFRRPRNVALILAPFILVAALGLLLGVTILGPIAAGAVALALAPAPLAFPGLAARVGARGDNGGELVAGSFVLSFAAIGVAGGAHLAGAQVLGSQGLSAFVAGAFFASALPQIRDLVHWPLARVRDVALIALAAVVVMQAGPALQPFAFAIAVVIIGLGAGVAALLATVTGRRAVVVVGAAGLKDPFFASALALAAVGPAAAAVPLAAGIILLPVVVGAWLVAKLSAK